MDIEAADQASVDLTAIAANLATDLGVSADSIQVNFASHDSRRLTEAGVPLVPLGPDQETGGGQGKPKGIGNIPLGGMVGVVPIVIDIFGQPLFTRTKIAEEFGRKQFQRKFTSQVRVNLVVQIHRMGLAVQARPTSQPGGC
jgi:hypothetical protein